MQHLREMEIAVQAAPDRQIRFSLSGVQLGLRGQVKQAVRWRYWFIRTGVLHRVTVELLGRGQWCEIRRYR
jgi:hypothetical protein